MTGMNSPIGRRRLLTVGGIVAGAAATTLVGTMPAEAAEASAPHGFTDGPGQIVVPYRAFDSRSMSSVYGGGAFHPGNVRTIVVGTSVQEIPSADHVFLTVTVTKTTGSGYLTVFPADFPFIPETSTLNWSGPGQTVSTGLLTPCQVVNFSEYYHRSLVKIRFLGTGEVHVIVDVTSTFGAQG